MQAIVELQVIPLGSGVSVRKEIARVIELLRNHQILVKTHATGTNIQGELKVILTVIEKIHETLHKEGSVRLISYIKLETRIDKTPTLADKQL